MRSSGSTRSPRRERSIRLWLVVTGEDHPRACTGRRLLSRGLADEIGSPRDAGPAAIVLDPHASTPLSPADRPAALRSGVIAIDCSWNRLADRGAIAPSAHGPSPAHPRRLPFLLATNPQHYGRLAELNTAEAAGAALFVLGARGTAVELLEGFAGGEAFFRVNRERLDRYARAPGPQGIVAAEAALFGPTPTGAWTGPEATRFGAGASVPGAAGRGPAPRRRERPPLGREVVEADVDHRTDRPVEG